MFAEHMRKAAVLGVRSVCVYSIEDTPWRNPASVFKCHKAHRHCGINDKEWKG